MSAIDHDNSDAIVERWDHPLPVEKTENLYQLLQVAASENDRIDLDLDRLYDDRFLETATGNELEKLGDYVGIVRKNDEPDSKLRKRILGGFAAQSCDTTYDSFASVALDILDASPSSVSFTTPPETGPKVVEIEVDGSVLDESVLTNSELVVLLNGALSADARCEILTTGTFAFDGDDDSLEGFNEGTWSSTVDE